MYIDIVHLVEKSYFSQENNSHSRILEKKGLNTGHFRLALIIVGRVRWRHSKKKFLKVVDSQDSHGSHSVSSISSGYCQLLKQGSVLTCLWNDGGPQHSWWDLYFHSQLLTAPEHINLKARLCARSASRSQRWFLLPLSKSGPGVSHWLTLLPAMHRVP